VHTYIGIVWVGGVLCVCVQGKGGSHSSLLLIFPSGIRSYTHSLLICSHTHSLICSVAVLVDDVDFMGLTGVGRLLTVPLMGTLVVVFDAPPAVLSGIIQVYGVLL
jgi:hypothetical protein